jgi:hypothetical protein
MGATDETITPRRDNSFVIDSSCHAFVSRQYAKEFFGNPQTPSTKDNAIIGRQGMPWSWWTTPEVSDRLKNRF